MKQIDHDPNEPKIDRSPAMWRVGFLIIALQWIWYFYFFTVDWIPLALGGFTGIIVTAWAIEITGNKVPESWRKKPRHNRTS